MGEWGCWGKLSEKPFAPVTDRWPLPTKHRPRQPRYHDKMQPPFGNASLFPPGPQEGSATIPAGSLLLRAGTTYALTEDALRQPA